MERSIPARGLKAAEERGEPAKVARLLTGLSDRAASRLEACLTILDRQLAAVMAGDSRAIDEIARLEASATKEVLAVEKSIAPLELALRERSPVEGARVVELERSRRAALRSKVLDHNKRNREALAAEIRETRRRIVFLRTRLGTPSPYASLGGASIVDIRT